VLSANRWIKWFLFRKFTTVTSLKPLNRREITDIGLRRPNGHPHQDIFKVLFRVNAIKLTSRDNRVKDRHTLSPLIGHNRYPVFPTNGQIPNDSLINAIINREITAFQETYDSIPVSQSIINCLGCTRLRNNGYTRIHQSVFHLFQNPLTATLPNIESLLYRESFFICEAFDAVKMSDKAKNLPVVLDMVFSLDCFNKFPAHMHHASHLDKLVFFYRIIIAAIAIGHKIRAGLNPLEKLSGRGSAAGFSIVKYGSSLFSVDIWPHVTCVSTSFNFGIIRVYTETVFDCTDKMVVDPFQWYADLSDPAHHGGSSEPDLRLVIDQPLYSIKRLMKLIFAQDYKEQQVDVRNDSWKRRYNRHLLCNGSVFTLITGIDRLNVDMSFILCRNTNDNGSLLFSNLLEWPTTIIAIFMILRKINKVFMSFNTIGDSITSGMIFPSFCCFNIDIFIFLCWSNVGNDLTEKFNHFQLAIISDCLFFRLFPEDFLSQQDIFIGEFSVVQN